MIGLSRTARSCVSAAVVQTFSELKSEVFQEPKKLKQFMSLLLKLHRSYANQVLVKAVVDLPSVNLATV